MNDGTTTQSTETLSSAGLSSATAAAQQPNPVEAFPAAVESSAASADPLLSSQQLSEAVAALKEQDAVLLDLVANVAKFSDKLADRVAALQDHVAALEDQLSLGRTVARSPSVSTRRKFISPNPRNQSGAPSLNTRGVVSTGGNPNYGRNR